MHPRLMQERITVIRLKNFHPQGEAGDGQALPHVEAWTPWYDAYGNTAEGFAALTERISAAAVEAGRRPDEILRSACAFVVVDRTAAEREIPAAAPPLEGSADSMIARLGELHEAGADEIILVLSPITERAIRGLGEVVAAF